MSTESVTQVEKKLLNLNKIFLSLSQNLLWIFLLSSCWPLFADNSPTRMKYFVNCRSLRKLFPLQHVHNNSSRFNCLHSKFAFCCASNTYWSRKYTYLHSHWPFLSSASRAQCTSSSNFTRRLLKSWKFNLPTNCYGDISLPFASPTREIRVSNVEHFTFYPSHNIGGC